MADGWVIITSVVMIIIALLIIIFYLIPIQASIALEKKDGLTGLKWRLLSTSLFIATSASPIIINRLLRYIGIESIILTNISTLATGLAFLAFSIAFVSVYKYKKKE